MGFKKDLALKYAKEYNGKLSKKALGKKLHSDYPEYFIDPEEARSYIRSATGSSTGNNYSDSIVWNIPEGDKEDYSDFFLSEGKALILTDIHFPYHTKEKVEKALEYGYKSGCDKLILGGDSLDCYYLSSHEKEPAKRSFAQELVFFHEFVKQVKANWDIPIYFKIGNHEVRWERFLRANPHIWDMQEFELKAILKFGELGIQQVNSNQAINFANKFYFYHGHEFHGQGGIYPAKSLFEKTGKSSACGHFHRISSFRANLGNTQTYSIGCLCDLKPKYMTHQRYTQTWEYGCAIISFDSSGFEFENKVL